MRKRRPVADAMALWDAPQRQTEPDLRLTRVIGVRRHRRRPTAPASPFDALLKGIK